MDWMYSTANSKANTKEDFFGDVSKPEEKKQEESDKKVLYPP